MSASAVSLRVEWRFGLGDEALGVRMRPCLVVTGNDAARLLSCQVAEQVERGALRLLLDDVEEAPWPVRIVHRKGRHGSARVRDFIDIAARRP